MRRGHRRSAHADVAVWDGAAIGIQRPRACARDADTVVARSAWSRTATDRDDVGLMRAQTGDRAARAVVGDTAIFVDGADCDRAGRAAGRADRARPRAGVAGRDADEDSLGGQCIDLARQRVRR